MSDPDDVKTSAILSNIRYFRVSKAYSQEYLAIKLGISQNAYSKLELGYSNITIKKLFMIADILEIDISDLLTFNKPL